MTLEGRVAAILSAREVAINIGSQEGVDEGMTFAVLAQSPVEVRDPSSGETLGHVDREKVRVKATEVHDTFSVCRTFERYYTGGGLTPHLLGTDWAGIFLEPRTEHVRTLKVEDSELPPPLPEEESYVKVGDRVREVARAD